MLSSTPVTSTSAAVTRALAISHGPRRGTAVSEVRIVPVLYSLPMVVTARTTTASWPTPKPI